MGKNLTKRTQITQKTQWLYDSIGTNQGTKNWKLKMYHWIDSINFKKWKTKKQITQRVNNSNDQPIDANYQDSKYINLLK